jgi:Ca-activated chloride channel family protein
MRWAGLTAALLAVLFLGSGDQSRGVAMAGQDAPVSIEPRLGFATARSQKSNGAAATFRINSDLVLVPVNVVDIRNRQVAGLTREQFKIYDDRVIQSITHFVSEDAPVSLVVVLDASRSMRPRLRSAREAVAELLRTANPADEFALIQFNDRVQRLVEFTGDSGEILNGLAFVQAKGETALLDAIYLAVDTLRGARHQRRAIVVISDGGDNCSRYSVAETRQMVREADAQIFAIGIFDPPNSHPRTPEEADGPILLASVAEETGGRMFPVGSSEELRTVATHIGATLRSEYLIGYSPSAIERDGKYHRVSVVLEGAKDLRLFWKVGYYAPGDW